MSYKANVSYPELSPFLHQTSTRNGRYNMSVVWKIKQFGFCMELGNGEKLTCCGDEPYNPCEKQYAENSTWLLHEAFCLESEADIFHPYEKHHSTVADASKLAEELHVKNLLLYHTEDKNLLLRKELYQNEGRKYFNGTIFVPEDLETLVL